MTARKTKTAFLFQTANDKVVYESRQDLDEDLAICTKILGAKPDVTIDEIDFIPCSECCVPPASPKRTRKPVAYSTDFQVFWEGIPEADRKDKQKTYKKWLKDTGQPE